MTTMNRRGARPRALAFALLGVLLLASQLASRRAEAVVLSEDELKGRSVALTFVLRSFSFIFAGRALQPPQNLVDANPSGAGIFDLRHNLTWRQGALKVVAAGQLTTSVFFSGPQGGLGLGRGAAPVRWLPLTIETDNSGAYRLRYQADRLYIAYTLGPVTVTLGRQPITFGRGQLWKPSDIISTFALTEVDTEFKPGSDAARIDWNIASRTSLTLIAAPAELAADHDAEVSLYASSFMARFKQGFDGGEIGVSGGLLRGDTVLVLDGIIDLGKLDLYGELVANIFSSKSLSPNADDPAQAALGDVALRAVLGARIKPIPKLTLTPEVFYNGLGSFERSDYLAIARSQRFSIGEIYNVGRVYAGLVALWEVHPLLTLSAVGMANVHDPSGLLSLGAVYSVSNNVTAIAGAYIPMGRLLDTRDAASPLPRSEFGLYPYFFFFELKAAI
ncbi:MAG: hypothetical protein KC503_28440 [Myxococcales bacterium]|nr:hypothetical protein [Myxococcales bacterium]